MLKHWFLTLFALITLTACNKDAMTMNDLPVNSPVRTLFAKTKPVCLGRFVIDVPVDTQVVWGGATFAGDLEVLEGGANRILSDAEKKRAEVKSVKHEERPGSLLIDEIRESNHRVTLIFWDDPASVYSSQAWTFLKVEPHGFISRNGIDNTEGGDITFKSEAVKNKTNYVSKHLRARAPDEIPTAPGVCIDHGFIADDSGKYQEIFQVGFRFPSMPDLSFSISSNKDAQRDEGLLARAKEVEKRVRGTEYETGLKHLRKLRQGKREIGRWQGEELLYAYDDKAEGRHQEFKLESQGVRFDKNQPFWTAELHTGVVGNRAGSRASGLTDDEAIVVWNTLLHSLRLRVEP